MAAIVTDRTDGQYVDPKFGVKGGVITLTQTYETNGVEVTNRNGARLTILTVNAVTDTDTLTTGIEGIISVAWQDTDPDQAGGAKVFLSTQAAGIVTFDVHGGTTHEGWLWVLHGGPSAATA